MVKIIGKIFFKSSVSKFLKYLIKNIKISKEDTQNNNCGLCKLIRTKVIGQVSISIKKKKSFFSVNKKRN